jgi:hypothetical protein
MDSRTHVEYAARLMPAAQRHAAVASLFPQIDRTPATLHRNYAHTLYKAPRLTWLGLACLSGGVPDGGDVYALERFRVELPRIRAYGESLDRFQPASTDEEFRAALLAFVSHLHLDTFNQPVQAFVPATPYCSGQWDLWARIGDFRHRLYVEGVVDELRAELFSRPLWSQAAFTPDELIHATCRRLAALAQGHIPDAIVTDAVRRLDIDRGGRVTAAVEYLREVEELIGGLHLRYLG